MEINKNQVEIQASENQSSCHENTGGIDLWYQEKRGLDVSFGLHVKKTLYSEKSNFQQVDVFDSTGFGRVLTLDGLMMCSERDEFVYHEMIAHVPLLSHPNPKKILIIGGGDGGTLREVLKHPSVEEAILCEIDGKVVEASRDFFPCFKDVFTHPLAKICIGDGIRFVEESKDSTFDVVIVDSADPIGPGVGLFSEEFYGQVKRILKPDGIVIAQCESPWDDSIDLKKVYGNLKHSFSHVYSMVGTIPSYPYGYWSWGIATESSRFLESIDLERAAVIEQSTRYYNRAIHKAAFAIPNFLRKKLAGVVDNL